METIRVQAYGSHKRLLPDGDVATVPYVPGETVKELLKRLKVSDEDVWMIVVNDQKVSYDYAIQPGDKVGIMSPVEGG
ncbi:MAG TPA: MoaD/ThiS family protein [Firmicutes bacterium]|nr:MoaD/ThiS family protein [Candidatus Fermentithermobacillaceae bacterium]